MTAPVQEIGKKYEGKKLRYSLLPMQALQEVVRVLEFGAAKYSEHNWRHVENAEDHYRDMALRHQLEPHVLIRPLDDESHLHHDAHAICCLLFKLQLALERKAEREAQKDSRDSAGETGSYGADAPPDSLAWLRGDPTPVLDNTSNGKLSSQEFQSSPRNPADDPV